MFAIFTYANLLLLLHVCVLMSQSFDLDDMIFFLFRLSSLSFCMYMYVWHCLKVNYLSSYLFGYFFFLLSWLLHFTDIFHLLYKCMHGARHIFSTPSCLLSDSIVKSPYWKQDVKWISFNDSYASLYLITTYVCVCVCLTLYCFMWVYSFTFPSDKHINHCQMIKMTIISLAVRCECVILPSKCCIYLDTYAVYQMSNQKYYSEFFFSCVRVSDAIKRNSKRKSNFPK